MDTTAFLNMFDQYNGLIYGYVFLRAGRNKEVAEDLTQEIFIKAWKSRDQFDQRKSSLKTWLFTIARNSVIDYWRKPKVEQVEIFAAENATAANGNQLESEVLMHHIKVQLPRLDQSTQDLIVWRYVQGLDLEEIAAITGKNYNATKVAVFRALQSLKDLING